MPVLHTEQKAIEDLMIDQGGSCSRWHLRGTVYLQKVVEREMARQREKAALECQQVERLWLLPVCPDPVASSKRNIISMHSAPEHI